MKKAPLTLLSALLSFFLVSDVSGRPASSDACFERWWIDRLATARADRGDAYALLPLRDVLRLAQTAEDPLRIAAAIEAIRQQAGIDPLVADEMDMMLLHADYSRSDLESASRRKERLGIFDSYLIGEASSREAENDMRAVSAWRRIPTSPNGQVSLHHLVFPSTRHHVWLRTYFHLKRSTKVALRYGADDRASIYIDGREVASPEGVHDFAFDQHAVALKLDAGWHRLTARVDQEEGKWTFLARLTRPDGKPLASSVSMEMPADFKAIDAEIDTGKRKRKRHSKKKIKVRTLAGELEERAKRGDLRARIHWARDLHARGLPHRRSDRALTLARLSVGARPSDPEALSTLATIESEPSRRRRALERWRAEDPTHPAAAREWVHYLFPFNQRRSTIDAARAQLEACGERDPYLEAWVALAGFSWSFPSGALAELDALTKTFPRQPVIRERQAAFAAGRELTMRARTAYREYFQLVAGDALARQKYHRWLESMLDHQTLIDSATTAVRLYPHDIGFRLDLARAQDRVGRTDEASKTLERALGVSPDHPAALLLAGEWALRDGREDEAVQRWRSALKSLPDPGTLPERIAEVTGDDAAFSSEWSISLEQARTIYERAAENLSNEHAMVVVADAAAYKVRRNGLSTTFRQLVYAIRDAAKVGTTQSYSFPYSPKLERPHVLEARLVRLDGTEHPLIIRDQAMISNPELRMWYDSRIRSFGFPKLEDGDLIEIRYRVDDRGPANPIAEGYFGDLWFVGSGIPVLSARLTTEAPLSLPIRHHLVNFPEGAKESETIADDKRIHVVETPPLDAYDSLPDSPPPSERLPHVIVGTATSWAELGAMYAELLKDQLDLDADSRQKVGQVLRGRQSRRDKISALYHWVIENTRYVALELGIHALKPYKISDVFHRRFGDCKDKAGLLVAMLEEAGIDAQIALVRTYDRGSFDTTVPVFEAFDHAIVYVPDEDLWLDGTVVHHGLEEIAFGDRGGLALLIDRSGRNESRLTKIPDAAPRNARDFQEEEITVQADGSASFAVRVEAEGERAAEERSYFRLEENRGGVLQHRLLREMPDIMLTAVNFEAMGLENETVSYTYNGRVDGFARLEKQRLSLPIGLLPPVFPADIPDPRRDMPVVLPRPFSSERRTLIRLGPTMKVVESPKSHHIDSPWGSLRIEARSTRDGVRIDIHAVVRGGRVSVDRLDEWTGFLERARQALGQRLLVEIGPEVRP